MAGVSLDGRVLAATGLIAVLSGLICGLAPASRATRPDLNASLKEGGAGRGSVGARRQRGRSGLVVAEIGLSLVLLIGAGLLLKSFVLLSHVDLGFNPRHVLVVRMAGAGKALLQPGGQELLARLAALPGVQAVGAAESVPPSPAGTWFDMSLDGGSTNQVYRQVVTPGYFQAMDMTLRWGRGITAQDTKSARPVVVVNQTFVKRRCGGIDPVGKVLVIHWPNESIPPGRNTIVGVVNDVRNQTLLNQVQPEAYYSYRQAPFSTDSLVLRTASGPMRLAPSVRTVIQSMEKNRPILSIQTMDDRLAHSITPQRFQTTLLTLFSAIALLLAAIGIYGLVSYSVVQRVREFGIRMALGAKREDIVRLVVGQAFWLAVTGLGLGLAGALALTRVLKSFLFQVGTLDPVTFVCVSLFLGGVALLAGYLPARRAAKVDPMEVLRYE